MATPTPQGLQGTKKEDTPMHSDVELLLLALAPVFLALHRAGSSLAPQAHANPCAGPRSIAWRDTFRNAALALMQQASRQARVGCSDHPRLCVLLLASIACSRGIDELAVVRGAVRRAGFPLLRISSLRAIACAGCGPRMSCTTLVRADEFLTALTTPEPDVPGRGDVGVLAAARRSLGFPPQAGRRDRADQPRASSSSCTRSAIGASSAGSNTC